MIKSCENCRKQYHVAPSEVDRSRFCSKNCMHEARCSARLLKQKNANCCVCKKPFLSKLRKGKWRQFCSPNCFYSHRQNQKEKECLHCGNLFTAAKETHPDSTGDGFRKYCSKKCVTESQKKGMDANCLNCGAVFYLAHRGMRRGGGCCSQKCQNEYYKGPHVHSFKGGSFITNEGHKFILFPRPGYVSRYCGEHRIVASRFIGRLLSRLEVVIRINKNIDDNRPENLYICESQSEFQKRFQGSLPWPIKSNLPEYASRARARLGAP